MIMIANNNPFENFLIDLKIRKEQMERQDTGHSIILVCGDTGSGKSTLINYLLDKQIYAKEKDNRVNLVVECVDPISIIGHESVSSTTCPMGYNCGNLIYYDTPGFEDTGGDLMNLINAYSISQIGNKGKNFKILAVIGEYGLYEPERGKPFRDFIIKLNNMFSGFDASELVNSLVFCFTKSKIPSDHKDLILGYKKFILDLVEQMSSNGGIAFDEKHKDLIRLIAENERFVTFAQPTKVGTISDYDKNRILDKLFQANFLNQVKIIPPVSERTKLFLEEDLIPYIKDNMKKDIDYLKNELCQYVSESTNPLTIRELSNKIIKVFNGNYKKDSDFIEQLKELTKELSICDLEHKFEGLKFTMEVFFEFLSYMIVGKSEIEYKNIAKSFYDILCENIRERFKNFEMHQELKEFEQTICVDVVADCKSIFNLCAEEFDK